MPGRQSVEVRTEPQRRHPEEFQFIQHRIESGVARMTLNRPEHNLLNELMLRELADGMIFVAEETTSNSSSSIPPAKFSAAALMSANTPPSASFR